VEWWQRSKHQWWDGGDGGEVSERTAVPFFAAWLPFGFSVRFGFGFTACFCD